MESPSSVYMLFHFCRITHNACRLRLPRRPIWNPSFILTIFPSDFVFSDRIHTDAEVASVVVLSLYIRPIRHSGRSSYMHSFFIVFPRHLAHLYQHPRLVTYNLIYCPRLAPPPIDHCFTKNCSIYFPLLIGFRRHFASGSLLISCMLALYNSSFVIYQLGFLPHRRHANDDPYNYTGFFPAYFNSSAPLTFPVLQFTSPAPYAICLLSSAN